MSGPAAGPTFHGAPTGRRRRRGSPGLRPGAGQIAVVCGCHTTSADSVQRGCPTRLPSQPTWAIPSADGRGHGRRSEVALFGDVTSATTFDPEKLFVRERQKLLDNGVPAINILRRCARRKETSQLGGPAGRSRFGRDAGRSSKEDVPRVAGARCTRAAGEGSATAPGRDVVERGGR